MGTRDANMVDWSMATIISVVTGMGIAIMGFQRRQNVAMERRLREDIRTSERRAETTDADVETLISGWPDKRRVARSIRLDLQICQ